MDGWARNQAAGIPGNYHGDRVGNNRYGNQGNKNSRLWQSRKSGPQQQPWQRPHGNQEYFNRLNNHDSLNRNNPQFEALVLNKLQLHQKNMDNLRNSTALSVNSNTNMRYSPYNINKRLSLNLNQSDNMGASPHAQMGYVMDNPGMHHSEAMKTPTLLEEREGLLVTPEHLREGRAIKSWGEQVDEEYGTSPLSTLNRNSHDAMRSVHSTIFDEYNSPNTLGRNNNQMRPGGRRLNNEYEGMQTTGRNNDNVNETSRPHLVGRVLPSRSNHDDHLFKGQDVTDKANAGGNDLNKQGNGTVIGKPENDQNKEETQTGLMPKIAASTNRDSNGIRPLLDIPLGPLAVIGKSHLSPISTSTPNQQRTFGDRLVVEDMEIDKSDEHTNKKSVYHSNHRLSQHERESKVTIRCAICDLNCCMRNWLEHIQGKRHRFSIAIDQDNSKVCDICGIRRYTNEWKQHLNSSRHHKMIKFLKREMGPKAFLKSYLHFDVKQTNSSDNAKDMLNKTQPSQSLGPDEIKNKEDDAGNKAEPKVEGLHQNVQAASDTHRNQNTQSGPNTQTSQNPHSGPDTQIYQKSQSGPDTKRFQNTHSGPDTKRYQNPQSGPNTQRIQNTQSGPDTQRLQNTQSGPSTQRFQNTQSGPDTQRLQNPQSGPNTQRFQNTQSGPDTHRLQNTQSGPSTQRFQNTQSGPDTQRLQNTQSGPSTQRFQNTQSGPDTQRLQNPQSGPNTQRFQNTQSGPDTHRLQNTQSGPSTQRFQNTQSGPDTQRLQNTQSGPSTQRFQNTQSGPDTQRLQNTQSGPSTQRFQNTQSGPDTQRLQNTQSGPNTQIFHNPQLVPNILQYQNAQRWLNLLTSSGLQNHGNLQMGMSHNQNFNSHLQQGNNQRSQEETVRNAFYMENSRGAYNGHEMNRNRAGMPPGEPRQLNDSSRNNTGPSDRLTTGHEARQFVDRNRPTTGDAARLWADRERRDRTRRSRSRDRSRSANRSRDRQGQDEERNQNRGPSDRSTSANRSRERQGQDSRPAEERSKNQGRAHHHEDDKKEESRTRRRPSSDSRRHRDRSHNREKQRSDGDNKSCSSSSNQGLAKREQREGGQCQTLNLAHLYLIGHERANDTQDKVATDKQQVALKLWEMLEMIDSLDISDSKKEKLSATVRKTLRENPGIQISALKNILLTFIEFDKMSENKPAEKSDALSANKKEENSSKSQDETISTTDGSVPSPVDQGIPQETSHTSPTVQGVPHETSHTSPDGQGTPQTSPVMPGKPNASPANQGVPHKSPEMDQSKTHASPAVNKEAQVSKGSFGGQQKTQEHAGTSQTDAGRKENPGHEQQKTSKQNDKSEQRHLLEGDRRLYEPQKPPQVNTGRRPDQSHQVDTLKRPDKSHEVDTRQRLNVLRQHQLQQQQARNQQQKQQQTQQHQQRYQQQTRQQYQNQSQNRQQNMQAHQQQNECQQQQSMNYRQQNQQLQNQRNQPQQGRQQANLQMSRNQQNWNQLRQNQPNEQNLPKRRLSDLEMLYNQQRQRQNQTKLNQQRLDQTIQNMHIRYRQDQTNQNMYNQQQPNRTDKNMYNQQQLNRTNQNLLQVPGASRLQQMTAARSRAQASPTNRPVTGQTDGDDNLQDMASKFLENTMQEIAARLNQDHNMDGDIDTEDMVQQVMNLSGVHDPEVASQTIQLVKKMSSSLGNMMSSGGSRRRPVSPSGEEGYGGDWKRFCC